MNTQNARLRRLRFDRWPWVRPDLGRLPIEGLRVLSAVMAAVTLLLGGCSGSDSGAVVKAEPGPIPAAAQRPGDPAIGRDVIVSGRYMTCGMPYSAWRRVSGAPKISSASGKNFLDLKACS